MGFPIADEQIAMTEAELGAALPATYRAAMKRNNGGEVETDEDIWFLHPILDNSDRKRISRSANHILRETKVALEWGGYPENGLCIGHNGSGDLLLFLNKDGKIDDKVYIWRHETGETEMIADDFSRIAE
jgi:hypothetical protein